MTIGTSYNVDFPGKVLWGENVIFRLSAPYTQEKISAGIIFISCWKLGDILLFRFTGRKWICSAVDFGIVR